MTSTNSLSLAAIDGMRHLAASKDIVSAVAFAARAGHNTQTCHRFVTALVMLDALSSPTQWGDALKLVMNLEGKGLT